MHSSFSQPSVRCLLRLSLRYLASFCLFVCFTSGIPAFGQTVSKLERAHQDYIEINDQLAADLREDLQQAQDLDQPELAREIERKIKILTGRTPVRTKLPRQIRKDVPHTFATPVRTLHLDYRNTCEKAARDLYLLARRTQTDAPTFAYELLGLTLNIDSDHVAARELYGYIRQGEEWMTPFERDQLRAGKVEHPDFGWLPASHVKRYEEGERYFRGTWVTAAKEAEIRRDFHHAWNVRTEHFNISTNVSLEQGVMLGKKLEIFHDYFKQTFTLFYNSPAQLRRLFDQNAGRAKNRTQLYEVHFFREKKEYVDALVSRIPQIAMTNGLYQLTDRTSYFYFDPEANLDATLFHEATHQLMYESHLRARDVGELAHFWIIEGIACYMESFRVEEDPEGELIYDVGDPRFVRFYWARYRLLEEDYYSPLSTFSRLGMVPFQTGSQQELQRRYSQASGLSHFFMHYDDGKYRNALMLHMAQLYHSDPRVQRAAQGLDVLTGVPYPTLDRQYREYLQEQQIEVGNAAVIQ